MYVQVYSVPNKTLYVSTNDLALWELAQAESGQSISALFAEFLRGRLSTLNTYVHVLRAAPNSQNLTVMFAPVGPTGSGGPGSPHYVGEKDLVSFLEENGVSRRVAEKIAGELTNAQSISELTVIRKRSTAIMSGTFKAGVQYGDWHGTVAADEHGAHRSFEEMFEATGKVNTDEEIMIGFEFYHNEGFFHCLGYFHGKPEQNDLGWGPTLNAKYQRDRTAIIPVKKVRIEITLEEFFKHFKRFNVMLLRDAMEDLIGREYEVIEGDE